VYVHEIIRIAFECVWGLTVLVWLVGIFISKRTARRTSLSSRLLLLAPILIGYVLVASHAIRYGWINQRLWSHSLSIQAAGLALTIVGCGFAIWARLTLGANWSGRPTVKEGHELIVSGPYALVRHPIYFGLLLALAGSALAVDRGSCILGWALVAATYAVKIRQEELLMMQTFPDSYLQYTERVRAFIPGIF